MEQKITTPVTKAIIISLVIIVISLAATFLNQKVNGSFQWIGYVIFLAGIILSITYYGKQIGHQSTFGNYFAHGFKVAAIVTIFMIFYVVIFMALFPEFKEKAFEEARKGMESKNLTEEQIDKGLEFTKKFFTVLLIGGTLVYYLFIGAIAALIGAAITKKNPESFQHDINQIGV
jgi:small-conductance mechanosensitive channel